MYYRPFSFVFAGSINNTEYRYRIKLPIVNLLPLREGKEESGLLGISMSIFRSQMKEHTILGKWAEDELDHILHESGQIRDAGARINFLSGFFLEVDYKESTLIGDANTPEIFIINLQAVDSFSEFRENLKKVRYRGGRVVFENRNHFFTDWREFNQDFIADVTKKIGIQRTKNITKILNKKEDGTHFLHGISPRAREIQYIPSDAVDDSVIEKMKTGDYAGIYSEIQGLDVSHVGIIIKDEDSIYPIRKNISNGVNLRHASSDKKYRKVIDQDLRTYISEKPGIIILRPKNL